MPAKFDPNDPETASLISLFNTIGLNQAKAVEAAKSTKNAASLKDLIEKNNLTEKNIEEKQGSLLAGLAVQGSKLGAAERTYIVNAIIERRLKSADQVSAATNYLEAHPVPVNKQHFDNECGVDFSIPTEELYSKAVDYVKSNAVFGWTNFSAVIGNLKSNPELRWANPVDLKKSVERAFTETFGAKEATKLKDKETKNSGQSTSTEPLAVAASSTKSIFEEGFLSKLHKPGDNPQIHPRLRDTHLAATGGQVWTRFPPEPNGFLHIGHSKAIFVDFGYAAYHGGKCYLRFDDTNPEAEETRYIDSIVETLQWLGFTPWKVTFSSDYFQELYELAIELIKRDKAYVCHCTGEEIHANRGGDEGGPRKACAHRTRPVAESLFEFDNMKEGRYRPGEAILRMKQDFEDGNPQMWDIIAYRNLNALHHRTHDKWKIYPTYDFAHCLVDSFENISHSLCTTEFIASRVSYEWLCDAVEVYKPRQYEFGRLSIQGTITSKRKLLSLVNGGYVSGWDDPRLYTLIALRRRGVPPGAILSFVGSLGVSTSISSVQTVRFEQSLRQYLEGTVPRLLMVLRPLKVTIENLPEDYVLMVEKPLHPKFSELGSSIIPFTRTIYIEADDFRLQDSDDYYRLAPGKTVGLFQAPYPITCISFTTDPVSGQIIELICRLENGHGPSTVKKPKAFIQWIAEHSPSGSPVHIDETRIFHPLFKSDNPAAVADYTTDINPDSLEIVHGAMVETGFWSLVKTAFRKKVTTKPVPASDIPSTIELTSTIEHFLGMESLRFQGLRVAYFALDKDTQLGALEESGVGTDAAGWRDGDRIVLNRIVSLRRVLMRFEEIAICYNGV